MAPPVNPFKFNAKKDFRVHSRAKSSNPQDTGSQIDSFREEGHASIAEGRGSSPHSGTIETIPPTPPPKSSRTPVGLFRKWSRSSERVKDIAPSIHDDPDDYDDGHDRGRPTIDSETGFQMVQVPPSRPVKDPQARNFNPLRLLRTRSREKQDDPIFTETQRDSGGAPVFAESPTDIHTRELPAPPSSSKGKNPLALFRKKPRESKPEDAEDSAPRKGWPERALDITWSGAPGDPAQPSRPSGESRGINPLRLFRTKSREQDPAPADSLGDDGGPGLAEDVVEEATNPLRRSKSRGANPLRLFRSKSREQEPPESPRDSVREQLQPAEDQFEHGEETAKPLTRKGSFGRNIFGAFSRSKPPEEEPSHSLRDEDPEGGLIPPEHQIEHIEGSAKPARKGSLRRNLFGGLFSSEQHERDTAPIVDTSREEAQTPGDQYQPESSADVEEHEIPLRPTRSRGLNPLGLFRSKSREQDVPIHDDMQDDEGHGITEDESRLENLLNVDDPIDSTRPTRSRGRNPLALFRSKSREQDPPLPEASRDAEMTRSPEELIKNLEDPVNPLLRKGSGGRYPFSVFTARSRGQDPLGVPASETSRAGGGSLLGDDPSRSEYVGSIEDTSYVPPRPSRTRKPLGLLESSPRIRRMEYGGGVDDSTRDDVGPKLAAGQVDDASNADDDANPQPSPASLVEIPWYGERRDPPPMTEGQLRFEDMYDVEEPVHSEPPPRKKRTFGLFRSKSRDQELPEVSQSLEGGEAAFADDGSRVDHAEIAKDASRPKKKRSFGLFRSKSREQDLPEIDQNLEEGEAVFADDGHQVDHPEIAKDASRPKKKRSFGLFRSKSREQDLPEIPQDLEEGEAVFADDGAQIDHTEIAKDASRPKTKRSFGLFRSKSREQDLPEIPQDLEEGGAVFADDGSRVDQAEIARNASRPKKKRSFGLFRSKSRDQDVPETGRNLEEGEAVFADDGSRVGHVEIARDASRPEKKGSFGLFRSKSRDQNLPQNLEGGEAVFADEGSRADRTEIVRDASRHKKKRSFGLFRSKSRDEDIPESPRGDEREGAPPPEEDPAENVSRGEGAASPLRRKPSRGLSLGLFKSRSRDPDSRSLQGAQQTEGSIRTLEDDHPDEAPNPLRPKRSLSLNPLRLFRTRSRDQETGSVRSQPQSGEEGSMPGETPSGRGSPYTQSQSRNPFRLFRKKSRGEASIPEAGAPGDGTSVHFADGPSQTSLPSGKAKKGGWRGILKRKKSEPTTDEPVPSAEAPELYPTRSNSPVIERQRLSIDPVHLQQNDDDSLYRQTLDDQDGPPPVVSLMTPETSPPQVLRRVTSPRPDAGYRLQQQFPGYEPPPTSILGDGRPHGSTIRVTGVTHVTPEDHVYKVVHENGDIASTQVSKGKPVQIGNYRLSVRYGDEEGEEELPPEESYPTRQQRDAGPAYPSQTPAGDGHVFLKPGDEYEIPPDGNVVFVVDEGIDLEIGNPETGVFVPYDEEYIRSQKTLNQEAYEETFVVPPGKLVEFQDEQGRVLHRTGGPKDTKAGMQDLGNGMWGGYQSDGSYLLQVGGPGPVKAGDSQKATTSRDYVTPRPPPSASPRGSESLQYEASQPSPNTLHTPPSSPGTHSHLAGSPMPLPSLGELIEELHLEIKKNIHWKPHGPNDYARSVRKWNIKPTEYTKIFCHEGCLFKKFMEHELQLRERTVGAPAAPGVAPGVAPSVAPSAAPSGGALLTAEDVQNDLEYVVPVTIGTPPQVVNLDFDTGSADLWVWSTLLRTSAANLKGHGIYNPGRSSTAKLAPGLNWKISYGDGSGASGSVYKDVVKFSNLAIPGQAVEVATQLSSTFLGEHSSDGLLGLAFPTINTITPTKQKTPVQELVERNIIKQPIFTAKLDKGGTGSFYTFGYIPQRILPASSRIIYTDVDSSHGFWEFGSPQLRVGRKTVNRRLGNTAIADTGTTLILLDDAALDAIYRPIPGARIDHSGWIVPTKSRPPDISFSVAGVFFAIAGEDLKFADAGGGMSFGSIQSRGQNRQDILGDVFLKRVLTVFDQTPGHPRIGFGQRAFT